MKYILYNKDVDDKDNFRLIGIIGDAIQSDSKKEDINISTSPTEKIATDSTSMN